MLAGVSNFTVNFLDLEDHTTPITIGIDSIETFASKLSKSGNVIESFFYDNWLNTLIYHFIVNFLQLRCCIRGRKHYNPKNTFNIDRELCTNRGFVLRQGNIARKEGVYGQ